MDPRDVILGEIQTALASVLGSSAAAVMRKAGIAASNKIWPELPENKSIREAGAIMTEGVKQLGAFGEFTVTGDDDGVAKIEFHNCYFAGLVRDSGMQCGRQPICYFGFGLVEETFRRLTGIKAKVELTKRDDGQGICFETATPR